MRVRKPEGIYTTHGPTKLLCTAARVGGKKALAFHKEGQETSYIPWEEVKKQMETGPYIEIVEVSKS